MVNGLHLDHRESERSRVRWGEWRTLFLSPCLSLQPRPDERAHNSNDHEANCATWCVHIRDAPNLDRQVAELNRTRHLWVRQLHEVSAASRFATFSIRRTVARAVGPAHASAPRHRYDGGR